MLIKLQQGQSLIEVLVALGSAVTIIIAISTVVVAALNNAQYSRNQALATQYAQEGVEIMRKLRDSNWASFNSFIQAEGMYCLSQNSTAPATKIADPVNCTKNVDSTFIRTIDIEKNSTYCQPANPPVPTPTLAPTGGTKITAEVRWTDSKCTDRSNLYCHKAQHSVCMTDYTVIPTP